MAKKNYEELEEEYAEISDGVEDMFPTTHTTYGLALTGPREWSIFKVDVNLKEGVADAPLLLDKKYDMLAIAEYELMKLMKETMLGQIKKEGKE